MSPKKTKRKPPPPCPKKLPQLVSPRKQRPHSFLIGIRRLHQHIPRRTPSPRKPAPTRPITRSSNPIQPSDLRHSFLTASECQLVGTLPPSPNLQTRSRRQTTGLPLYLSHEEHERISRLLDDFEEDDIKPCSVFGGDRQVLFRNYFFCANCRIADDQERAKPNLKINRRTENGKYTCRAKHTSFGFPTYTMLDEEDDRRKKAEAEKKKKNKNTSTTTKENAHHPSPQKRFQLLRSLKWSLCMRMTRMTTFSLTRTKIALTMNQQSSAPNPYPSNLWLAKPCQ